MDAKEVLCPSCKTANTQMRKLCKSCKAPLPLLSITPPPLPGSSSSPPPPQRSAPPPIPPPLQPRPPASIPVPVPIQISKEEPLAARPLRRAPIPDSPSIQAPPQRQSAAPPAQPHPGAYAEAPPRSLGAREQKMLLGLTPLLQAMFLILVMGLSCAVGVWLSS